MKYFIAVLLVVLGLTVPTTAQATNTPVKGMWLTCSTASYCLPFQQAIAFGGITKLLMPYPSNCTEAQRISNQWYGAYGTNFRIRWYTPPNRTDIISCVSHIVGNEGYYIVDEPSFAPYSASQVNSWSTTVRTYDYFGEQAMSHWGCSGSIWLNNAQPYLSIGNWQGATCYPVTNQDNSATDAGIVYSPNRALANNAPGNTFSIAKAFSWADGRWTECANQNTCQTDKFPSQPEFRAFYDCAAFANLNRVYLWGYDDWKDWRFSGDPATVTKYNGRWGNLVNGFMVAKTVNTAPCST